MFCVQIYCSIIRCNNVLSGIFLHFCDDFNGYSVFIQVEELKAKLVQAQSADVSARLEESESLMKEISQPWEEKVRNTEKVHVQRQQALEKMGISVEADGIKVESDKFYLVNLNADPSLNEMLLFNIKVSFK